MVRDALFPLEPTSSRGTSRKGEAPAAISCDMTTIRNAVDADSIRYDDGEHLLIEANSADVLLRLPEQCVDLIITDPPYTERTHAKAKTNRGAAVGGSSAVDFTAFDDDDLYAAFTHMGRLTRGWVIATVDYRHALTMEERPPDGLEVLRIGIWVKDNPMPQISGDRPGQGWEAIAFLHRTDVRPRWNGGGRSSVWRTPVARGLHPTTKPVGMLRDWVRLFGNPGDLILDPFAGSASTAVAAKAEGRRSVSIECDRRWIAHARDRLAQGVLPF